VKGYPQDIRLKVEVLGIYALPDEWAHKAVSVTATIDNLYFRMTLLNRLLTMKSKFWGRISKEVRLLTNKKQKYPQLTFQAKTKRVHRHHLQKLQPKVRLLHQLLKKN
jgi:hypothetical protein